MPSWPAAAASFPTVSGTFDEDDLLAVSIGGNDARFYQQNGGTVAGAPAAATASAAFATAGLNALVGAGAQNISFLAGNTAILPEIASNPAAQAVRNAYSTTFNTAIQSTLAGYAADGVIVHYLDLTLVAQQIIANPAAYGLTGVACPALPNTSCIADPGQKFLFYFDQLHLTSAGFAIVGQYIATQLEAPLVLQGASDMSLDVAHQFGRTLTSRMDTGAPRDGDMPEGLKVFWSATAIPVTSTPVRATRPIARAASARPPASNMASARALPALPSTTPGPRSISAMTPPETKAIRSSSAAMAASASPAASSRAMPAMAGTSMTSTAPAWSRTWRPIPRAIISSPAPRAAI